MLGQTAWCGGAGREGEACDFFWKKIFVGLQFDGARGCHSRMNEFIVRYVQEICAVRLSTYKGPGSEGKFGQLSLWQKFRNDLQGFIAVVTVSGGQDTSG